jgi:formylglycine-generating enzyme required for sulfatase activity
MFAAQLRKSVRLVMVATTGYTLAWLLSSCVPQSTPVIDLSNYWVEIPAGEFSMGFEEGDDDEIPVHTVYLDSYLIEKYEITNSQYDLCVKAGICPSNGTEKPDLADHPAMNLSWSDAQQFCQWINGRLPTEAEWENAARGKLQGKLYPWGNEEVLCDLGAKNGVQFGYCAGDTQPVGSFAANGYGLYDMAGNTWEWVADWYGEDFYQVSPAKNPKGPESGKYRVIRGGAWNYTIYGLRVTYRSVSSPESKANFIGFRCAKSVSSIKYTKSSVRAKDFSGYRSSTTYQTAGIKR